MLVRLHAAAFAVLLALAVVATPAGASHDVTPARVAGDDRVETAADVARLSHPDGATNAVVARAGDWPDALAGAPLAGLLGAPVLLTDSDQLSPSTAQVLQDLGVTDVTILGGPSAVSEGVEQELAQDHTVERLAGATRYETAADVARAIDARGDIGATPGGMRSVFLAAGDTFADALAAGAPAALGPNRMPILLTQPDSLPQATVAALDELPVEQVLIAGGTEAVSADVQARLEARGLNVVRFEGATRTETAAALADFAVDILPATPANVHLARSDAFPDGLTAGPLAASANGPLLLADGPDQLGGAAADWLRARCPDVQVVRAVGGSAAVSTAVLEQAEQAAQSCHPVSARLAYLSRTGDPIELITETVPDGSRTVVATDAESTGGYDWAPDGSAIVYTRFVAGQTGVTELVIAQADGSGEQVLTSNGTRDSSPVFSPDGQRVAFVRGPATSPGSGLYMINRDGTGLRQVVDEPDADPLFPDWSPDGQRIVYERFPDGGEPQIVVIDADGTDQRLLSPTGVRPEWSPDGALIAFVSAQTVDSPNTDLYVVEPDATGLRRLATDVEGGPVWSPDGQLIAFSAQAGGANETDLALVNRDGTGDRVVADVRPLDGSPTFSPDGQTLGFVAAQVEGATDVYTVQVDGTDLVAVTSSGNAEAPSFGPGVSP